jgi:hypothetical protein
MAFHNLFGGSFSDFWQRGGRHISTHGHFLARGTRDDVFRLAFSTGDAATCNGCFLIKGVSPMERDYGFPSSFGTPQGSSFSPCRGETFQAARSGEKPFLSFCESFSSSLWGIFLCHCEERSDEAVPPFVTTSEAKQSHEIASPDEKARLAMTRPKVKERGRFGNENTTSQ